MTDAHRRFLFDQTPVRGGWVHIDAAYREVLARHDYPPVLRRLLGELLGATALLADNLKFEGSLIVQVQSAGPLRLLVVECTDQLGLRAIAKWDGNLPHDADLLHLAPDGRCVITLDPRGGAQMFQGIVAMESGAIAEVLEHHMQRSEQLATRMWLAADGERATGLMLQRLPAGVDDTAKEDEVWERLSSLGSTAGRDDLLRLDADALLHRLFADETVRTFSERTIRFECGCGEARAADALLLLGRRDIEDLLAERGQIEVACEFCNRKYEFDRGRALSLFAARQPTSTMH